MPMPYQLKNMYNEGQFEDIMELANIPEELQGFSEWDYYYYMQAAYKLKNYDLCLNIFRKVKQLFPNSKILNDKCGWALYHTHIKGFDKEKDDAEQYKKQLLFIINNSSDSVYSPAWRAVRTLLKACKNGVFGNKTDYELINQCLDNVKPENLSDMEISVEINGKSMRQASDREIWYLNKVKALKEVGQNEECRSMAVRALRSIKDFHNNNDMWIVYYASCSSYALKNYEEAKKSLQAVLNAGFEHFSVWELLYKINREEGNTEEALRYGALCSLSDNNHKMRVNFYPDYGEFLYQQGFVREAMLHRQLSVRIREENNWNAKNFQSDWAVAEEIEHMSFKELQQQLQSFWREKRDAGKVRLQGKIKNMLASGRDGFILGDNGQSYYFQLRDIEGRYGRLEDARVSFIVTERMDKKRNIVKENAYRIIVEG